MSVSAGLFGASKRPGTAIVFFALAISSAFACRRMPQARAHAYIQPDGFFSITIPPEWRIVQEWTLPPQAGIQLLRENTSQTPGIPASIAISFYPKGNPDFAAAKDYLQSQAEGRNATPPRKTRIGGLLGWEFASRKPLPVSPEMIAPGFMILQTDVLDAGNGFFVVE